MELILKQIHSLLIQHQLTLAVAESCTGGLLAKMLTDFSGSSGYFLLGIVSYHNQAKIRLLKVPAALIAKEGAVSAPVTRKMAHQVRKLSGADYGIGITGIAGPSGGTLLIPVGTVFIALASPAGCLCRKLFLRGSRASIRRQAALSALQILARAVQRQAVRDSPR
ncbi:MAG: hypothetical protein A3G38_04285 [Omnitrophica WOR_2 bacterium RIFCSPLOWO2_12_FULL_51_8]|nr:MAG: hypothetical protein A3G38_04285 [Omnitrophica WOR_2 bacterium RIFCSPLOWO2_12_FULL_51_8]